MGNICHAGPVLGDSATSGDTGPTPRRSLTFGRDPSLKREDYVFSNITGPSCLIKQPGSINGQQFLIENCRDCDIFILDHCTAVQIDDCVNCRIVIGPCDSSLFVRNCKKSTIVCALQQFRTRDCDELDVYLYSATEPIIELSTKMRFACFPLSYFSFQHQFEKAGFSVWNNRWSEIYNFTPDHGTWKALSTHCHQSALEAVVKKHPEGGYSLWKMQSWTAEELGLSIEVSQLVVPLTSGVTTRTDDATSLVVIFSAPRDQLMTEFVVAMTAQLSPEQSNCVLLVRTRQMKLSPDQAKALFSTNALASQKAADATKSSNGSVIMEFQGNASYDRLTAVMAESKFATDATFTTAIVSSIDSTQARRMSELVFVEWKETI